jgi:hypothetical protein
MKKIFLISILAGLIIILLSLWVVSNYYGKKNEGVLSASEVEEFRNRKAFFSDFTKREEGGDVWMDSDKAKVSVKIPKDWIVYEGSFSALSIVSKDFVPFRTDVDTPFPSKGCGIDFNVQIDKKVEGYKNFVQEALNEPNYFSGEGMEEKIKLNFSDALKTSTGNVEKNKGKIVTVQIPKNNFTYKAEAYLFGEDREKCEKEFDLFLNSLVLK